MEVVGLDDHGQRGRCSSITLCITGLIQHFFCRKDGLLG